MLVGLHTDGRRLEYDEYARKFVLGTVSLTWQEVAQMDKAGQIRWDRAQLSQWFYDLPAKQAEQARTQAAPVEVKSGPNSNLLFLGAAVLVIAVALVAGIWWVNFTRTPNYSLGQLGQAIESRNLAEVQKYLDIDALVSQIVDAAIQIAIQQEPRLASDPRGPAFIQDMRPALIKQTKDAFNDSILKGGPGYDSTGVVGDVMNAKQVKDVRYSGGMAIVTVETPPDKSGKATDIQFRMVKKDKYWQVTGIENLQQLIAAQ